MEKNPIILETAIQDDKVMQDFELESLSMGADHSLKVKAAPIESDYSSKGCVNLSSSIAVSRIIVGARTSPLSRAQFEEVQNELFQNNIKVMLSPIFVSSTGDLDQKTSLRILEKTNFFTKEIDEMLLSKKCRIAIHSAKDLPEPIPKGLSIIAITKGVDSSDSLVMQEGYTLENLPLHAVVATSSERREQVVKALRPDLRFIDLRGTIDQRLAKLKTGEADAVIIAEAAIIRLKLTHLNRFRLPGTTTPLQGQLAIMARSDDIEMCRLFSPLDSR
jgi:hydroxymethylbilane synthase